MVGARRAGADGDRAVTDAGLVVVDKPSGMTSHDVVAPCRRIFATRKVGHAGTLDPMATGVLVIGIERATKILGLLTATTKSYAATIRLGRPRPPTTPTATSSPPRSADALTDTQIEAAVAALRGEIRQIPSAVSAVKVGGKRAYRLAREGHAVELVARPVRIERFEMLAISAGGQRRRCRRRGGLLVGHLHPRAGPRRRRGSRCRGHLTALRRTRVGRFGLDQARTLDELADCAAAVVFARRGLPAVVSRAETSPPTRRWPRPTGGHWPPRASTASTRARHPTAGSSHCCATKAVAPHPKWCYAQRLSSDARAEAKAAARSACRQLLRLARVSAHEFC